MKLKKRKSLYNSEIIVLLLHRNCNKHTKERCSSG